MSYHSKNRIFHLKIELTPPYGFSIFGDPYLGPMVSPEANFGVVRLSSVSSFE